MKKRIIVAITGASGAPYSKRLFDILIEKNIQIDVVLSNTAKQIWKDETGCDISYFEKKGSTLFDNNNIYSPISSGSTKFHGLVIIPASMGTLGRVACGISDTLITRVADVTLKEQRKLILVTRETPFNTIHLENMLRLSRAGATILPASPAFYNNPVKIDELIDFIVGRVLDHLGVDQELTSDWEPTS